MRGKGETAVGEGEEKRKSLTTRKVAKVEEEPTIQKPSRAAICCSNLIQFLSTVSSFCTLRNIGYLLVIGGISYLAFVIYQNHFNSVQMAEMHRQQLLQAQQAKKRMRRLRSQQLMRAWHCKVRILRNAA